jgi:general stress protein YciG
MRGTHYENRARKCFPQQEISSRKAGLYGVEWGLFIWHEGCCCCWSEPVGSNDQPSAFNKEYEVPNRKNNQEQGGREGQRRDSQQVKGRGFAGMDPEQQREIASEGGRAAHASGHAHEFTSEEARAAGRKGGEARSHAARNAALGSQSASRSERVPSETRSSPSMDRDVQGSDVNRGGRGGSGS